MEYVIKTTNGTLIHTGTKGQKWGVRHWQFMDGRLTEEGKYRYGRKKKPEDLSKLSDAELRDKLNRARMENEYRNLTKKPESEGKKVAKKIVVSAVTAVGIGALTAYGKDAVKLGEKGVAHAIHAYKTGAMKATMNATGKAVSKIGSSAIRGIIHAHRNSRSYIKLPI